LVEFGSMTEAQNWYNSCEYENHLAPLRWQCDGPCPGGRRESRLHNGRVRTRERSCRQAFQRV